MSYARRATRALGLCFVAVLGLMAFGATAQGAAGLLLVLNQAPPAGLFPINFTGSLETLAVLSVPGLAIEIDCTSIDVVEGKFTSDTEGLVKILLLGCVYRQLGDLTKGLGADCLIKDGGVLGDITAAYKLKPILAGALQLLILASGDDPAKPGRIELIHSTGCSVPELVEVKGSVVWKLSSDNAIKQLVTAANHATQLVLDDLLFYGAQAATIGGSWWIELTGAHANCTWGSI